MNWLAHVYLSELNIDFQMGNYLTDFLKAKSWDDASNKINEGMRTHIFIDSFTDSNKIIKKSKKRLREKGLLKSIIIDISFDYFLTKNWDKFCTMPFEEFTSNFYKEASLKLHTLPNNANDIISRAIKYHTLNNYKNLDELELAFIRFDRRLSTKLLSRDSASSYFEAVKENILELENDFLEFFPQLCKETIENRNLKNISHIKV